jgi:hypothetical protein
MLVVIMKRLPRKAAISTSIVAAAFSIDTIRCVTQLQQPSALARTRV